MRSLKKLSVAALCAIGLAAPAAADAAARPADRPALDVPYSDLILKWSAHRSLDPYLVAGVVRTESAFRKCARSWVGAAGLMQLMPATAAEMGLRPHQRCLADRNLQAGTKYLALLMDQFGGQTRLAVAAYNAGPSAVTRYGGVPPYSETRRYVVKVLRSARMYRRLAG